MDKFANLALEEYNSSDKTVRRAGNGQAFWNVNSSQFTFVPQLEFPEIPGARAYLFTATDSQNKNYTFEADSPIEPLTAIWKDLAPGFVSLKVEAIHRRGDEKYLRAPVPSGSAIPSRDVKIFLRAHAHTVNALCLRLSTFSVIRQRSIGLSTVCPIPNTLTMYTPPR